VLRLTGLPAQSLCPRVDVSRNEQGIVLDFSGEAVSQVLVVPVALLAGADPEQEELELLGALKRMGYETIRRGPLV
jgi:predicted TIM-barrel enzyme